MNKKKSRIPSPARSTSALLTPRRHTPRRVKSLASPSRSNASNLLTSLLKKQSDSSGAMSPIPDGSILNDNTDVDIVPQRKSWYKRLGENSVNIDEVEKLMTPEEYLMSVASNNSEEDDVLAKSKPQSFKLALESSDSSSTIPSIVVPRRKLFPQKETKTTKEPFIDPKIKITTQRKRSASQVEDSIDNLKDRKLRKKTLFSKPKTKPPEWPNIVDNENQTIDKTVTQIQKRNLFSNKMPPSKAFANVNFLSESEDDSVPVLTENRMFGRKPITANITDFPNRSALLKRLSEIPPNSPTIEFDDWNQLPSSTMIGVTIDANMSQMNQNKAAQEASIVESEEELNQIVESEIYEQRDPTLMSVHNDPIISEQSDQQESQKDDRSIVNINSILNSIHEQSIQFDEVVKLTNNMSSSMHKLWESRMSSAPRPSLAKRQSALQPVDDEVTPTSPKTRASKDGTAPTTQQKKGQTSLDQYLQKIAKENIERKKKAVDTVINSIKPISKITTRAAINEKRPLKVKKPKPKKSLHANKTLANKSMEIQKAKEIDGVVYKAPKLFMTKMWMTPRLYKFLETKLEPKYGVSTRVRSEKFVRTLNEVYMGIMKKRTDKRILVRTLMREMARLEIVQTYLDFYSFVEDYMPFEFWEATVPNYNNTLPVPKNGVLSNILG